MARTFLYDDTYYSDRKCDIILPTEQSTKNIPNLKTYAKFNDKCSSLKIQNYSDDQNLVAILVVYENDTYNIHDSGHSYYFYADYNNKEYVLGNLKYLYLKSNSPVTKSKSWNDRISSCKFYFSKTNQLHIE